MKHLYLVYYCLLSDTNVIATSTVRRRQVAYVLYMLAYCSVSTID
jgi:hypothetical protein